MKRRILVLLGTRPEAIKLAPVIMSLRKREADFETVVCSTGQHREMLDQAMDAFGLKTEIDLGLMTPGQTLAGISSLAFSASNSRPSAPIQQRSSEGVKVKSAS